MLTNMWLFQVAVAQKSNWVNRDRAKWRQCRGMKGKFGCRVSRKLGVDNSPHYSQHKIPDTAILVCIPPAVRGAKLIDIVGTTQSLFRPQHLLHNKNVAASSVIRDTRRHWNVSWDTPKYDHAFMYRMFNHSDGEAPLVMSAMLPTGKPADEMRSWRVIPFWHPLPHCVAASLAILLNINVLLLSRAQQ